MTAARQKRVVGTAGHIDHGKTSLVRAITGVDCDRLPEEKRRGITIDLGFANWTTDEYQIGFVDVPGHERFVKNMLAGVGGIDAALLVVAAEESVKPQTREHLAICKLLRIPTGVVAITKTDLVESDIVDLVRLEVEDLVRGSFLEGKPIVPVSSTTGAGIDSLKQHLIEAVAQAPPRDETRRVFRLPIDRAFTMKGFGSVITGTAISGALKVDDRVDVLPGDLSSRARSIQVHGSSRDKAVAGERTSVNLPDIPLQSLHRGQQLVSPGTLKPSQILTVELELLPDAKKLDDQTRIRFHHYSAELLGTVRLLSDETSLAPGAKSFAQIRLESPVIAVAGDRFVIRRYSPQLTIGGGRILDAHIPKLNRKTRGKILDTLASDDLATRLVLLARLAGLRGVTLADVQVSTGFTIPEIERQTRNLPEDVVKMGDSPRRWVHRNTLNEARKEAMYFLRNFFQTNRTAAGVPKSEFTQKLFPPDIDSTTMNQILEDFRREKIIETTGDQLDIPGRSKRLSGVEGDLARTIEERFLAAELKPPPVSELINTIKQKPVVIEGVVSYLVKTGVLVRLADGIYIHSTALTNAKERMAAQKGQTIDVGWFKDFFGLSRKIAIPLLEHFDRIGVTKRQGDQRLVL